MTNWANVLVVVYYVFFTTIAEWFTDEPATPTGVGCEEVKRANNCCVFYNVWHDSLDFTMELV